MIHRFKEKLHGNRGASTVFAIILLLICSFAGSAALASANTNISRFDKRVEYQQSYLSASSAARLIIDEIKSCESITATVANKNGEADFDFAYGSLLRPNGGLCQLIWEDICKITESAFYAEADLVREDSFDGSAWQGMALRSVDLPDERELIISADDENIMAVTARLSYSEERGAENLHVSLLCGEYGLGFDVGIEVDISGIAPISPEAAAEFKFNTDRTEIVRTDGGEESR